MALFARSEPPPAVDAPPTPLVDGDRPARPLKVALLVNGATGSAMGERARGIARRLGERCEAVIAYRERGRLGAVGDFVRFLRRERPDASYVLDMGYSGVVAAAIHRATARCPMVIDTGDAIFALARSAGLRGPLGLALTWALEQFGTRRADRIVVRGTKHRELLLSSGVDAVVVPDGIDVGAFTRREVPELRRRLGLDGVLSVGFVGSMIWSDRLGIGYGWELVEALRLLDDEPVKGVLIGSGSGRAVLEARARSYGLGDRILFLDPIPMYELQNYLSAVDVWLSTQTNDVPGNVRTTGKLPLYMAAGCYVLASDVGEASLVLPPEMRVEYRGVVDAAYPERLAGRIRDLIRHPERLRAGIRNVDTARRLFDYSVLGPRVAGVIESVVAGREQHHRG